MTALPPRTQSQSQSCRPRPGFAAPTAALAALAFFAQGCATQNDLSVFEPGSREALQRMSDVIADADRLSFTADLATVDSKGNTSHTTSTRITIDRPNKIYAQESDSTGVLSEFFFDASHVTLVNHPSRTYATTGSPATIDEALDMSSRKFGLDSPLALVVRRDPLGIVTRYGGLGKLVGTETFRGVNCDLFTFSSKDVSWSVWIGQHDGLPHRLAARANEDFQTPTHYAELYDWNLNAQAQLDRFEAKVPGGYQKVDWRSQEGGEIVD